MKEFEIHYLSTEGPGLFCGLGIGHDQKEATAYFLDAHGSECKAITAVRVYKNRENYKGA